MACYNREAANTFGFIGLKRVQNGTLTDLANLDVCPISLVAPAPTAFQFTAAATTTLDASCVSLESAFQWEIATDIGFTNIVQTIINSSTTVQFTGLEYNTEYFGRCRALGTKPSDYSNVSSENTLHANPLDLFGSNVHAWYRGDDVVLNGVDVSQWNDKSGNARHFVQATAINQPRRSGVAAMDVIDNREYLHQEQISDEYMDDNGNFAGLGSDPYFVVVVQRYSNLSALVMSYSRADVGDVNQNDTPHYLFSGSTGKATVFSPGLSDSGLGLEDTIGNRVIVATCNARLSASENYLLVINGVVEKSTAAANEGNGETFDTIRLFEDGALTGGRAANKNIFYELIFIKGVPEDYATEFNELHTGYLDERYPSLGIVNPNLS